MKNRILTPILILLFSATLKAQLTIVVTSLPTYTSDRVELYLAGTFNNWAPDNKDYRLTKNKDGFYSLTLDPPKGELKFKFTRGSWATVEGNREGSYRPDRILNYFGKKQTVYCNINSWEGNNTNKAGTAQPNVLILDPAFKMPQLDRNRRIWIYLPPDYDQTDRSYPVIYLQDGQNLFDKATSFSGEWKVDETLNQIAQQSGQGFIAVGIDNGSSDRMAEYSPWPNTQYGGGRGGQYVKFLVETLKPFIDKNFRTLSGPENTAIIGSSLGGLISFYAAIEYPEVFGKAGVFSPAFWYTEGWSFWHVVEEGRKSDVQIYMIGGAQEKSNMAGNLLAMARTLLATGFSPQEIHYQIHADGEHKERYWAREFSQAVYWLFGNNERSLSEDAWELNPLDVQPLTANAYQLTFSENLDNPKYSLISTGGTILSKPKKIRLKNIREMEGRKTGQFKIKPPKTGPFYLQLLDDTQLLLVEQF